MPDQTPTTPLSAPADEPVAGATVVIEAPSAEEALTQLHEQLGVDARIIEVRRVARGGVAGFFARELVELHAAPGASAASAASAPSTTTAPAAASPAPAPAPAPASEAADGPAATSPIDRLLRADEQVDDTVDFATYLRNQLRGEPTPAAPAPPTTASVLGSSTHEALLERATAAARLAVRAATGELETGGVVDPATDAVRPMPTVPVSAPAPATEPTTAPAPAVDAEPTVDTVAPAADAVAPAPAASAQPTPATDGADLAEPAPSTEPGPAWSIANLIKLGLPAGLVRGLEVAPPADDVAWTAALATALRPVCRPLPSGPSLLVGPRARAVATKRNLPLSPAGEPIRSDADVVAVVTRGNDEDRRWIERARGTRWLHVVAGGSAWRDLLQLDPLAVSWATRRDLPEAVRLATELGLVLGAGPLGRGVQRARPMDVTLAIRALLPVTPELTTGDGRL